jgi:hypothetical protein
MTIAIVLMRIFDIIFFTGAIGALLVVLRFIYELRTVLHD